MLGFITEARRSDEDFKQTIIPTKRVPVEIVQEFSHLGETFFVCIAPDRFIDKQSGYIAIHRDTGLMASHPKERSEKNFRATRDTVCYKTPEQAIEATIINVDTYISEGKDFAELIVKHKQLVNFVKPNSSYLALYLNKILK